MKRFYCTCGNQVFFDSHRCLNCGAVLGFDPEARAMVPLESAEHLTCCSNGSEYGVCNWLRPTNSEQALCTACQFNRTIPNLSVAGNRERWAVLEEGKKRLFFTLMQLGLPLENGWADPQRGLLMDFMEDARSNPGLYPESFVSTGYLGGVITINTLEADDAARTEARMELRESYRTVLGHLRHESGHYYWSYLNPDDVLRQRFAMVFGDETVDYQTALKSYYDLGPAEHWREAYISAYASAHPSEDWAETWGHYLHIYDALETAAAHGLLPDDPSVMTIGQRIAAWQSLSVALNEMTRSVGRGDAYPFVIGERVAEKLQFVDEVIRLLRTPHPA
ncbi:zinc-binding metallopeptidase family protein [Halioglobus pacificus]|uniref:Zinc-ribbon domain-containing protein n=1 Tax=Parahalioglobus pacificus TaxID=930806 RepID=A0A918XMQ3_9GAMM|nr:putative zinc-binding metallopeptidase [Halioglobus pacificus]NQY04124.1 putative zinc-binding metallopeptidase [Halieaceae bacterium]GHD39500.1 hypothetical protein GCM10007053_31010 [Halioglobus pacificus]